MYKFLFIIPLVLLFTTISSAQCCCTEYPTKLKTKIDSADLVMAAYLVATKPLTYNTSKRKKKKNNKEVLKYIFKAYTIYKGDTSSRIVSIYSYTSDACGVEFMEGKYYIVYALHNDNAAPPAPDAKGRYYYTESCRYNSRRMDFVIEGIEKITPAKKRWFD